MFSEQLLVLILCCYTNSGSQCSFFGSFYHSNEELSYSNVGSTKVFSELVSSKS
ncbi:hypothetical protein M758_1G316400 [Ceratodon purpureus]|uniref:Uncharacterized protein n=1 Tax=Ceratodon purpureus TaxID=3225 RepID=A0A8T0JDA7_CERPU|nr:hypothetical protein KC19_1G323300 [Ceratodon purpureus]KAG0632271.1 hypothetical protein M758_1G316400 [Ceratodon purpureus]